MKRVQFGDIIEVKTSKGLAYAIFTHRHDNYGAVIQVFDLLYASRPQNWLEVAEQPIRFATFFPLQAAVSRNIFEVVGGVPIPSRLVNFPIFRSGNPDRNNKVDVWWLKDLQSGKSWRVEKLTPDQRRLPILSIWNDTALIHRIEEGWRPETDLTTVS